MKGDGTKRFVLDASVTLAWCFADESTARTEAILDLLANGAEAITPPIWPFEVANALLVGERRKRISVAQVTSVLRRISTLPIAVAPITNDHAFERVLSLARQEHLSHYDASYLDLALRESLPLATLDENLSRAAKNAGIVLVRA